MTPFILLGLIILFWSISDFITFILLFLFWVSVVYQILNWRKKKKAVVPKAQEPMLIIDETKKPESKTKKGSRAKK